MKIGKFEIDNQTAAEIYGAGQYVVTYGKIYQLFPPHPAYPDYRAEEIYSGPYGKIGLAKRGTWKRMTAEQINRLLGFPLLAQHP